MRIIIKNVSLIAVSLLIWPAAELLGQETGNARGPIVDSPYEIVSGWLEPFQEDGYAFGGNSAIWAETADRIIINQRGETILLTLFLRTFLVSLVL